VLCEENKFDVNTTLTSQVMDCQILVIGKALFTDPVTYSDQAHFTMNTESLTNTVPLIVFREHVDKFTGTKLGDIAFIGAYIINSV